MITREISRPARGAVPAAFAAVTAAPGPEPARRASSPSGRPVIGRPAPSPAAQIIMTPNGPGSQRARQPGLSGQFKAPSRDRGSVSAEAACEIVHKPLRSDA